MLGLKHIPQIPVTVVNHNKAKQFFELLKSLFSPNLSLSSPHLVLWHYHPNLLWEDAGSGRCCDWYEDTDIPGIRLSHLFQKHFKAGKRELHILLFVMDKSNGIYCVPLDVCFPNLANFSNH